MEALIRPAGPQDAAALSRFIVMAGGPSSDFLFRGLKRGVTPEILAEKLCLSGYPEMTHRHFFVMEDDGVIIAVLNLVPSEDLAESATQLANVIREIVGLRGMLRLLYRALRLSKERRSLRYPDNSLIIVTGAVIPEYRRKGVAKQFMAFAAETARARGRSALCVVMLEATNTVLPMCQNLGYEQGDTLELRNHRKLPHNLQRLLVLPVE